MARTKKSDWQKFTAVWWGRALLAGACLGVAYGFASWAVDSGNWLHYGLAILFLYLGIKNAVQSVRLSLAR